MTVASLLERGNDPAFAFEHARSHSQFFGLMSPLTRFSVLPYLLDPESDVSTPAGEWNLNHQQAHNDFLLTLPSYFGATRTGIPISQVMVDVNLNDPEQRTWWEFTNLIEHQMGGQTSPPPGYRGWQFPFW